MMRRSGPSRAALRSAAAFQAPCGIPDPPPKSKRPGAGCTGALTFGGVTPTNTRSPQNTQPARRAAIEDALPGQLDRRARDAAAHRATTKHEAIRMASRWTAENKWRRTRGIWA